jgi:hypothetical protein
MSQYSHDYVHALQITNLFALKKQQPALFPEGFLFIYHAALGRNLCAERKPHFMQKRIIKVISGN